MDGYTPTASEVQVDLAAADAPVYLTFCDGPDPWHTPMLLFLLAEREARVTFFVRGSRAARYPRLVQRMAEAGHTIGHLGWNGHRLSLELIVSARREIDRSTDALADILGAPPTLYRPPHGFRRGALIDAALARGQHVILEDRRIADYWPLARPRRITTALETVCPGMIIAFNDSQDLLHRPAATRAALNRYLYHLSLIGLRTAAVRRPGPAPWAEVLRPAGGRSCPPQAG